MAGVVVDAQQNGFSGRGGGLQSCGHLRWVKGRDAWICDAGGEQHGGIRGAIFHRLITVDYLERLVTGGIGDGAPLGFLTVAVLFGDIAQWIGQADAVDHGGEEIGAFSHRAPDGDAAGGAAADGEMPR